MKKDWTEILKDKLSESEATPPKGLWDDISAAIPPSAVETHRQRRFPMVWRWVSVAACIAVMIGIGISVTNTNKLNEHDTELLASADTKPETNAVHETSTTENESDHSQPRTAVKSHITQSRNHAAVAESLESSLKEETELAETADDIDENPNTPTATETSKSNDDSDIRLIAPYNTDYVTEVSSDKRNKLSFSLFAFSGNLIDTSGNSYDACMSPPPGNIGNGGTLPPDPGTPDNPNSGGIVSNPNDPFWNEDPDNPDEEEKPTLRARGVPSGYKLADASHKQPLKFGASARYRFDNGLSITSGITYSMLSSSLTWMNNANMTKETHQTLHYLGIPLSVDYNIPSFRSFEFYFTGGAMVEKCIYGTSKDVKSAVSERVSEKELQFSLFAGGGIQFDFTKHIALYAEPLATYYIDNHSDIVNIYKDRKFSFDLRFGLRVTLK